MEFSFRYGDFLTSHYGNAKFFLDSTANQPVGIIKDVKIPGSNKIMPIENGDFHNVQFSVIAIVKGIRAKETTSEIIESLLSNSTEYHHFSDITPGGFHNANWYFDAKITSARVVQEAENESCYKIYIVFERMPMVFDGHVPTETVSLGETITLNNPHWFRAYAKISGHYSGNISPKIVLESEEGDVSYIRLPRSSDSNTYYFEFEMEDLSLMISKGNSYSYSLVYPESLEGDWVLNAYAESYISVESVGVSDGTANNFAVKPRWWKPWFF